MSIRRLASAVVLLPLLASPAGAAETASWSSYLFPIAVGAAVGAVALPYAFPMVAPSVGSALTTTGGAIQAAAPAVGAAALDAAAASGAYASGAASSASGYVLAQTAQAQIITGAALGAMVGWVIAPR